MKKMKKCICLLCITGLVLIQSTICFAKESKNLNSNEIPEIGTRSVIAAYRYTLVPNSSTKTIAYGAYDLVGDNTMTTNTQSCIVSKAYSFTSTLSGSLQVKKDELQATVGYSVGSSETVTNTMNSGTGYAGYQIKSYARPIYTTTVVTQLTTTYLNGAPSAKKYDAISCKRLTGVSMKQSIYKNNVFIKDIFL